MSDVVRWTSLRSDKRKCPIDNLKTWVDIDARIFFEDLVHMLTRASTYIFNCIWSLMLIISSFLSFIQILLWIKIYIKCMFVSHKIMFSKLVLIDRWKRISHIWAVHSKKMFPLQKKIHFLVLVEITTWVIF